MKRRVLEGALSRPWSRYPEFDPKALLAKLAAFAGWRAEGILAGNGSNELASERFLVLADDLEMRTWQSNREFWKRRDRRSLRDNRYYRPIQSRAVVGFAVTDLDSQALAQLRSCRSTVADSRRDDRELVAAPRADQRNFLR